MNLYNLISNCIPSDHASQVNASYFVTRYFSNIEGKVLDLGCGNGRSIDLFQNLNPSLEWYGLDLENSPEVKSRTRDDGAFFTYDGENIPFSDNYFDIIYSVQVFEHVRKPEVLLKEVFRVLKSGGSFIGSLSYLEPYHSFSFWNITPYGWHTILVDAGLEVVEFRPGIDGISLIRRSYLGMPKECNEWFELSPINTEIISSGQKSQLSVKQINYRMILFCGHLVFYAKK